MQIIYIHLVYYGRIMETSTQTGSFTAIRAALPRLGPAETRIAEQLLGDPESFVRLSIRQIAELGRTSTTTVARFHKHLGFESLRDLRHAVSVEVARSQLELADTSVGAGDIDRSDPLEQVVAKVARDETLSIADTEKMLDLSQLDEAVRAVVAADRTAIFGVGSGSFVAEDLQGKLSRIGRTALFWADSHAAWTSASLLREQDVAIAVSHSGNTTETVEFLRLAHDSGATTVAISNANHSTLTRLADVVLRTHAHESRLRSGALGSRIAQLMVVDCLFIGVVQRSFDDSTKAINRTYRTVRARDCDTIINP